eukprot:CAMPEP_0113494050 /NCGR_PEP_ID=MMETSP0014_2-20120614/28909_1 /TAXON_ID=2857 /ORGANISM="Nitzschia sp." /LENGTH=362 /DNA_ID=CAMNT_0000387935 /DNA_START=534 /DNA_END=1622 /DNA_ORIENTATION=+ /assembly_acc=CAM_ASM_000159
MNSLIFLTTDMHRNDYFTTSSTTTGPESASGTASASTTLTRPQQSTATTASIRMVPSKASQSRSIVNAATAIARADAHDHYDHGHEDHHEDLAASAVSTASQQGSAATAEGNSGRAMSQSMPFPSSHVHRTASEVQLCEDEEMAERRDLTMFYRLVNGIRERQTNHHQNPDGSISSSGGGVAGTGHAASSGFDSFPIDRLPPPSHYYGECIPQGNQGATAACALETERSLAHIIQTRNSKLGDAPPGPATAAAAAAAAAALEAEGADLEWPTSGYGNDLVAAIPPWPTPTADRSSLALEIHPPVHQGDMYMYHHTPPTAPSMMPMMTSTYDAGMDHHNEDPVAAATGDDIDEDDEGIFDMEL